MVTRRVVIVGCMLWCWLIGSMFLGLFLGSVVTNLLRSHAISMIKPCGGGCKVASSEWV